MATEDVSWALPDDSFARAVKPEMDSLDQQVFNATLMSSNDDLETKYDPNVAPKHHKDADFSWNFRNFSQSSCHRDSRRIDRALIYWKIDETPFTGGIQTMHCNTTTVLSPSDVMPMKPSD